MTTTGGTMSTAVRPAATASLARAMRQRATGLTSMKTASRPRSRSRCAAVPMTSAMSGMTVRITSVSRISGASDRPPPSRMSSADQDRQRGQQDHEHGSAPAQEPADGDPDDGPERRSSADQVAEHALERIVGRSQLVDADVLPAGDRCHDPRECPEVRGSDGQQAIDAAPRRRRRGRPAARSRGAGRRTSGS